MSMILMPQIIDDIANKNARYNRDKLVFILPNFSVISCMFHTEIKVQNPENHDKLRIIIGISKMSIYM